MVDTLLGAAYAVGVVAVAARLLLAATGLLAALRRPRVLPTVVGVTDAVPDWLAAARRICVLTGAGISTDSGLPDYRGPDGVWTRDPDAEKLVTLGYYLADPEIRRRSWLIRAGAARADPKPNAGHAALVDLERQGRLRALITQNIDGLHQAAGSSSERVLEIHGTVHEVVCVGCGDRTPMSGALARVAAGEPDPACLSAATC